MEDDQVGRVRDRQHEARGTCERIDKNPTENVETRSQSPYKAVVITPQQTLAILNMLTNPLHYTLVLTCAATALRASEIISLRWSDILWNDGQIRISKRWAKGEDGETKTAAAATGTVHAPCRCWLRRGICFIYGNPLAANQAGGLRKPYQFCSGCGHCFAMYATKLRDRLVAGIKPLQEPHYFDIAMALRLQIASKSRSDSDSPRDTALAESVDRSPVYRY